ncbi:MAG TPA: hypothetical protein VFY50_03995 [Candidatus Nitrosocosmicus sp.]|nr:hypothetical protein [Candidatus Nitrosocosmicus sp.]
MPRPLTRCAEEQQIDNQIASSTAKLNSLALHGIHFMNTLNQFSANMHANMTSPKILPMVFVNISLPKDSQVSESLDKHGSKEQLEEK